VGPFVLSLKKRKKEKQKADPDTDGKSEGALWVPHRETPMT
jgi:hypothetical protein